MARAKRSGGVRANVGPRKAEGRGGRAGEGPMPRGKKTNKSSTPTGRIDEPRTTKGGRKGTRRGTAETRGRAKASRKR